MTKQQAVLLREADLSPAGRGDGATTLRLVNQSCGSQSMINSITTVPPVSETPLHYQNYEENSLVFSSTFIAVVGEIEFAIKTVDVTWTPSNLRHQFQNGSDRYSMCIFLTYASAGVNRTIVKTGKTHFINAEHKA